jgi:hypothetical protein
MALCGELRFFFAGFPFSLMASRLNGMSLLSMADPDG